MRFLRVRSLRLRSRQAGQFPRCRNCSFCPSALFGTISAVRKLRFSRSAFGAEKPPPGKNSRKNRKSLRHRLSARAMEERPACAGRLPEEGAGCIVASQRGRGCIQINRRREAVQCNESTAAAPAISDRPNAVACAKVKNFAQARKPHV